jgi:hypothetical protein
MNRSVKTALGKYNFREQSQKTTNELYAHGYFGCFSREEKMFACLPTNAKGNFVLIGVLINTNCTKQKVPNTRRMVVVYGRCVTQSVREKDNNVMSVQQSGFA